MARAITSQERIRWWRFSQLPYPLAGVGVICAADAEGETCDVPFNTAEMTALTYWIEGRPELPNATVSTPEGVVVEVDFNAPDAPTSQAEFFRRMFGEDPITDPEGGGTPAAIIRRSRRTKNPRTDSWPRSPGCAPGARSACKGLTLDAVSVLRGL